MSLSSRDYQRAAGQRFTVAEFLLKNGYNLDAMYLAGYAIECSLKAVILSSCPDGEQEEMAGRLRSSAKMHLPILLAEILRERGRPAPVDLVKRFRRFHWTTDLRYESGRRPTGEAKGLLRNAKQTLDWAAAELEKRHEQ
jgi:HEPN domain-containing protein